MPHRLVGDVGATATGSTETAAPIPDNLIPEGARRLDANNVRRVIRALELVMRTGRPLAACQIRTPLDADVLVLGLRYSRSELNERIEARVDSMFAAGLVDEVRSLRERGWA